jgi:hypothetical protein
MTNDQPARSKYGREFKPTIRYKECIQQLSAKFTTREDFVEYSEEDKTRFLNNPILLARKSSTDLKAFKPPDSQKFKETM